MKKFHTKFRAGPRIQQTTANFLIENFKTLNAGAEYILNSAPTLFNETCKKIEKRFKAEDLYRLKLAFEEFKLNPQFAGRNLLLAVAVADQPAELLKLIKNLSEAELFWLEIYLKNVIFEEVDE